MVEPGGTLMARLSWAAYVCGALLLSALVPSGTRAQPAPPPPSLRQQQNELFQQVLRNPASLETTLAYARVSTELGDFEAAITALERLLFFNPALARPRLELGVLYYRLGSYGLARSYLEQARAAPDLPADEAALIDRYLSDVAKLEAPSRLTGTVFTGIMHESNANFGPTSDRIRIAGLGATLLPPFTKKADESWVTTGSLAYSYDFEDQDRTALEITGTGFASRHFRVRDFDLLYLETTVGVRSSFASAGAVGFSVKPYLIGDYVLLGGDGFFHGLGAGVQAEQQILPDLAGRLTYEIRNRIYRETVERPTARELTGLENAITAQLGYSLTPNQLVTAAFTFIDESTRIAPQDYHQYGFGLGYQVAYAPALPIGDAGAIWKTAFSVSRILYEYAAPDPRVDPAVTRFDRVWRLGVVQEMAITDWIGAYVQLQLDRVRSSIENFSYNNVSVLFGPQIRF